MKEVRRLYEIPCIDWNDDGEEIKWTSIIDESMTEVTEFKVGDLLQLDHMPFDRFEDGKGFVHHTGWCRWNGSEWQDIWEEED